MSWLSWLNNNKEELPFWAAYKARFKEPLEKSYVAFDCETTGLDPKKDRILSIGAVKFTSQRIFVSRCFEWFVQQDHPGSEAIPIHGILPHTNHGQIEEQEAIIAFLKFIGNATLVGHHVKFDVAMINRALKHLGAGSLKNKLKDTNRIYKEKHHCSLEQNFSLDDLCSLYDINCSNRHTAMGDAFLTAQLFQRLLVL